MVKIDQCGDKYIRYKKNISISYMRTRSNRRIRSKKSRRTRRQKHSLKKGG